MTTDPYAPHLRQADDLFDQGEIIKAGQIWQAVLKQNPSHAEARKGLLAVRERLLALREAEAAAMPQAPEPPTAPPPEPAPVPEPEIAAAPEPEPASVPEPELATAPEPVAAPGPEPVAALEPELAAVPKFEHEAAPEPEPTAPSVVDPRSTAPEASAPVDSGRVITGSLSPERLLTEGCTLYDMGQIGDALRKWEQVLALHPDHALARNYANGARREMGMPLLQAPDAPTATQAEAHPAEEDLDKLLREAVQLYDMGLVEEAISKWERVLVLEPQRHEVEGYLRQARAEVLSSASSQGSVPVRADAPESEALDLKLRQAEHLLNLQRYEEAVFTFQQALSLDPGNARALQGLERCRNPSGRSPSQPDSRPTPAPVVTLDSQGRIAMAMEEAPAPQEPQGVEPPAALLQAAPARREGPSLPDRIREAAEKMPWLKDPKILAGIGGGILLLAVVLGLINSYRNEQATKEEVRASRATATASVAQQAQAPELTEAPAAIRQEAETALGTDPLRAYLRAEALVNRNSGDAAAAQLLEKARTGLAGGVAGASLPEFQKHLKNGDLEAALKVIDTLLRAQPGDADLRARAGRLQLTLCFAHASQAKWEEAQEDLLRGRALFPGDKTWQVRLKLLEQVKTMPKAQQPAWIALLG